MTKFNEWWQTKSADFHEDADAWSVGQGWRAREPEIESLRQQLDAAEANCQCELIKLEQQLADATEVANLSDGMYRSAIRQLAEWTRFFAEWESPGDVHEALISLQKDVNALNRQLAESQARDEALRDALVRVSGYEAYMEDKVITNALALPSDSTALDLAISQAKRDGGREALLEAINEWEKPYGLTDGSPFIERLRRMADNLKD